MPHSPPMIAHSRPLQLTPHIAQRPELGPTQPPKLLLDTLTPETQLLPPHQSTHSQTSEPGYAHAQKTSAPPWPHPPVKTYPITLRCYGMFPPTIIESEGH
ncbi:hypothetical protein V6N12_050410 [Hibiscus sabdariffa]|uniref:Uncharacterized protein n=1 Tax=Hibiscus sabdariffa TaxID=183260 RepID=A0ABR2GDF8_9ROSI